MGGVLLEWAPVHTAPDNAMNEKNINDILRMLPHRFPFLLVDRVLDTDGESYIEGLKNVTVNEPCFQGHFPENPIFPGVLLIEAMAQTAGLMLLAGADRTKAFDTVLLSVDQAKFRRKVLPGDQLRIRADLRQRRASSAKFSCSVRVEGALVAQCELFCGLVPVDTEAPSK